MNVPFDPDTFTLLLKSQLIFIDHLLYARHFTISLVAFKGIGSGLHLSIYLTVLFVDVNPKCTRMPSHPIRWVRPWDLQLENLGSSSICAICYLGNFGKDASTVFIIFFRCHKRIIIIRYPLGNE